MKISFKFSFTAASGSLLVLFAIYGYIQTLHFNIFEAVAILVLGVLCISHSLTEKIEDKDGEK